MHARDALDAFVDGAHWTLFFLEARLAGMENPTRQEIEAAIQEVRKSLVQSRATRVLVHPVGRN